TPQHQKISQVGSLGTRARRDTKIPTKNAMRRYLTSMLTAVVAALACAVCAQAQTEASHVRNAPLPPNEVQRIIQSFTAKETQFRQALNEYGIKRDAVVHTIGCGNQITVE